MSENKQFYINVDGQSVPVTEEVYRAYHKMGRRERYLEERDIAHGTVSYSGMDTDEMTGEETIPDLNAVPVDEGVCNNALIEQLRKHLDSLNESERELIDALFFSNDGDGMSEREYADMIGLSKTAVHARKIKVFEKLRSLMDKKL